MGKYALVASCYNRKTGKFENERIVKIDGVDLTKLHKIDEYTSGIAEYELWNKLIKEYNLDQSYNHFAVCDYSNDRQPIYYKAIFHNPTLNSCAKTVETRQLRYSNGEYSYAIDQSNVLFLEEMNKIEEIIRNKDLAKLHILYPKTSELPHLIERQIEYTETDDYEAIFRIKDQLSKYKNFRNWILANIKNREYQAEVTESENIDRTNRIQELEHLRDDIILATSVPVEEEIHRKKEKKQQEAALKHQTHPYNLQYLDEDIEEFLDEEEVDNMYDGKIL